MHQLLTFPLSGDRHGEGGRVEQGRRPRRAARRRPGREPRRRLRRQGKGRTGRRRRRRKRRWQQGQILRDYSIIFYAVPVVVITSLAMSWLESFFILPNHMQHFIKSVPKHTTETSFFLKTKLSLPLNWCFCFIWRWPCYFHFNWRVKNE